MAGEFERIARLRAVYGESHLGVPIGIGDDAALLDDGTVISVDAAVEDVHFRRRWVQSGGATWPEIGARATAAALSDLAAMGARPRALLSSLIVPSDLDEADLDALARGVACQARMHAAPVVGGNLARGRELSITTTVIGRAGVRTVTRGGARPGDRVWVTGTLGARALGVHALEAGRAGDAADFVRAALRPVARIAEGERAARTANAMIDVSDGLVADLGHVCRASGVGARIDARALPLAESYQETARALGLDPLVVALTGGEDYELVIAAPRGIDLADIATAIGEIVAGEGVVVEHGPTLDRAGHDHFAR